MREKPWKYLFGNGKLALIIWLILFISLSIDYLKTRKYSICVLLFERTLLRMGTNLHLDTEFAVCIFRGMTPLREELAVWSGATGATACQEPPRQTPAFRWQSRTARETLMLATGLRHFGWSSTMWKKLNSWFLSFFKLAKKI